MAFDPIMIVMLALVVVLIFFMFRNGKKRQQAMAELQNNMRPGAEVMLQSGIYGVIEEVNEAENRVTVRSGTSTLVVHRNAVSQVISAVDAPEEPVAEVAPDDDPEFGERIADSGAPEEKPENGEDENPKP
ncbi:MAG: preprotein translocase subunit YajC [Leucobacter sp.]